jgi:hypothetical protein
MGNLWTYEMAIIFQIAVLFLCGTTTLAQKCRAVRLLLHRSGLHLIGNRDRDRMCVYMYVPLLHSAGGNSRIQISPPHRLDFFCFFLVDDEIIELF